MPDVTLFFLVLAAFDMLLEVLHTLLAGNGLLRAFARTGIRPRSLAPHRKTTTVTQAPVGSDILEPRDILRDLSTQLPFDDIVFVEERRESSQLVFMEIASLRERVDTRLLAELAGYAWPHSINVLQREDGFLLGRNVNTHQSRHGMILNEAKAPEAFRNVGTDVIPAAACGGDRSRPRTPRHGVERSCTCHTCDGRWREPSWQRAWPAKATPENESGTKETDNERFEASRES
jgi:hypothetical protein